MKTLPLGLLLMSGACAVWAQTRPIVYPRGVVKAFTQLAAPAFVGRGGIVQINGLNLGPPAGLKAPGTSLPTQLSDDANSISAVGVDAAGRQVSMR